MTCDESRRAKGRVTSSGPLRWTGLPEEPTVRIYLPPGYDASDRAWPLAIMFDGQNVFDDEGSYRGGWQMHRLLDWRACRGQEAAIVVALETGGWSRASILSPWSLGDRTLEWIASWLVPAVRRELRVASGAESVLVGGSSLGGLLALYAFVTRPETFGRVMAMSPSLGLPGGRASPLLELVERSARSGGRVYVDAGARECECTSIMHLSGTLAGTFERKGYRAGSDVLFVADPEGAHDEASWKRRLPAALDFLLP